MSSGERPRGLVEELMMGLHHGLQELFFRHRLALLDRDVGAARTWLVRFRDALLAHMQDEEALVLPVYAARGGTESSSPPEQFEAEHRKLREQTSRLLAELDALRSPPDDRALLALIDLEASYRSLLEHHDLREARVLYPSVSRWATDGEQAEIVRSLRLREIRLDP